MEVFLILIVLAIVYVYAGYPLFMRAISFKRRQGRTEIEYQPSISLVIAAHNEDAVIEKKIQNALSLDYPDDKMQIIVTSDASTDRTNEIVAGFFEKGISLYNQKDHKGKSAALNHVVEHIASGEILVFNDATTLLESNAVKQIASYFFDETIGAVAGRIIFKEHNNAISSNHGLYWKYEELLRESESNAGFLPFVSGAFYAIRKNLYTKVPESLPDDSVSPLGVYRQKHSVIYAKDAVAYESGASDPGGEFEIKARGVVRELSSIFWFKGLLNPIRYPLLSLVLISHRLLRWSVPVLLSLLFLVNIMLYGRMPYTALLWLQTIFYTTALCGLYVEKNRIVTLPFYFCLVNAAALWGVIQFIVGKKRAVWTPVRGS